MRKRIPLFSVILLLLLGVLAVITVFNIRKFLGVVNGIFLQPEVSITEIHYDLEKLKIIIPRLKKE